MRAAALALVLALAAATCGGDERPQTDRVADARRDQAEQLARRARLPQDVQDFLGLAAEAVAATFTVAYESDGKQTVLVQKPPVRRIDVRSGAVTESFFRLRDGTYACRREDAKPWTCSAAAASAADPDLGVFAPEALDRAVDALGQARSTHDFAVAPRRVAGVEARCLVTTPKLGGPADELCVAPTGAVLRIRTATQSVEATSYEPRVDPSALRLPAAATSPGP